VPQDNHGLYLQMAGRVAQKVPGLRALPVVRLVMAAEVLLIGKHHLDRLTPEERGRMVRLVAKAKGRPRSLTEQERVDLAAIVEKLEPRAFLATAGERLSPVGMPESLRNRVSGSRKPPPAG
jgi:hypothetical protein